MLADMLTQCCVSRHVNTVDVLDIIHAEHSEEDEESDESGGVVPTRRQKAQTIGGRSSHTRNKSDISDLLHAIRKQSPSVEQRQSPDAEQRRSPGVEGRHSPGVEGRHSPISQVTSTPARLRTGVSPYLTTCAHFTALLHLNSSCVYTLWSPTHLPSLFCRLKPILSGERRGVCHIVNRH